MAVYTHNTPARYTHGSTNRVQSAKGARATTFSRYLKGVRTRSRGTSWLTVAKRIYSQSFPTFGGSLGTTFYDSGFSGAPRYEAGFGSDKDLIEKSVNVVGKSSNTFRSHV